MEDSLIVTRKIREQQAAQDRQVQALQRTLRRANLCYENGYWNFLEVLDGQRSLLAPSCSRYSSNAQDWRPSSISNKAPGGGWVP